KKTLSKQVLDEIINLLIEEKLKPGDKFPSELELMEQLKISRPVLREALSSLETLEIITRKPRGGTYINYKIGKNPFRMMLALFINNTSAIIEARMTLELGLVTIAAEKITDEHLAQLKETINNIKRNKSGDYGVSDKKFHRIIAHSANNSVLDGMIESLLVAHEKTDNLIPYREPDVTIKHHTAIYQALKNRDPIESFQKMYNHLDFVRTKIISSQSFKN